MTDLQVDIWRGVVQRRIEDLNREMSKLDVTKYPARMFEIKGEIEGFKKAVEYIDLLTGPRKFTRKVFKEVERQLLESCKYDLKGWYWNNKKRKSDVENV